MTTMLERAARALAEVDEKTNRRLNMYGIHKERYDEYVLAVLMAVREPDDAMIEAGRPHMPVEAEFAIEEVGGEYSRRYKHFVQVRPPHECVSPAGPFTAMIDSILTESE